MPHIKQFDHIGITVADLDKVTAFFIDLGLEIEGRTAVEGDFIDVVTGIPDSRSEIVMLRPPGGGTGLELATFVRPEHDARLAGGDGHRAGDAQRLLRRSRTSRRSSTASPPRGTDWSGGWVATRTPG